MTCVPSDFSQLAFEVGAYLLPRCIEDCQHSLVDDGTAVLGRDDQVCLNVVDNMSAAAKIGCACHRRSYDCPRARAQGVLLSRLPDARAGEAAGGRESALRFLWNLALEQRKLGLARPRDERIFPTAFDQINQLTELRAELPWLADVPRNVCSQLLVELDKAFQRCFRRLARAPRFKRKGRDFLGLTEPHPKVWRLDGSVLRFPKLGNLKTVVHRSLEGKAKSCTLRREGDQWFVSILCEQEVAEPAPKTEPVVALDRGVRHLVADSDGQLIPNPSHLEHALKRLARAQRVVSRRQKGSKNRQKANARVARLHRTIRRQREHALHELSSTYAKNHGTVIVERLQIANMVQVRSSLARRILDAGWGRFVEMLRYKLAWRGGRLIEVAAAYSSQTCSACGHVDARSRRADVFRCGSCGYSDHADLNAAKVLKSRANRSALPPEGALPVSTRRKGKVVALRVPRRSSTKPGPSGRG